MIVMGYPGIGKSTLAEKSLEYIDLETSNWWNLISTKEKKNVRVRPNGWEKIYCKVALDLSRQGYIVFTSPNKDIRNCFTRMRQCNQITDKDIICVCFPSLKMQSEWTERVRQRYIADPSDKNARALDHVLECYVDDVTEMAHSPFIHIKLFNKDYDLESVIQNQKRRSEYIIEERKNKNGE